jgi:hypothetical protein
MDCSFGNAQLVDGIVGSCTPRIDHLHSNWNLPPQQQQVFCVSSVSPQPQVLLWMLCFEPKPAKSSVDHQSWKTQKQLACCLHMS